jgi:hypothetical protein
MIIPDDSLSKLFLLIFIIDFSKKFIVAFEKFCHRSDAPQQALNTIARLKFKLI